MRRYLLYLLLLLHGCALSRLPASIPSSGNPLKKGDELFQFREKESSLRQTVHYYREALKQPGNGKEASWKFAMAAQSLAARYVKDENTQKEIFLEAATVAKQAAEQFPDCGPCHFWTAINMALYGQTVGAFKMLFTLGEIKERLEKSAELDPRHALGGPYRVLGTIYQELPGIIGGDVEKAAEYFEKAIALLPQEPLNYLALVKLLSDQGNKEKALLKAQEALSRPDLSHSELESVEAQRELRALVSSLTPVL